MIHPRNSFTLVPQASTLRCHSDFRVLSTLFSNFRAFLLQILLFRLKGLREPLSIIFLSSLKVRGYFCHHTTILTMLTWIYGVPGLQPKNARKTRNFVLFYKNRRFLRSNAFHWVTLPCKKESLICTNDSL